MTATRRIVAVGSAKLNGRTGSNAADGERIAT
jgi:hypothetical protein